MGKPVTIEVLKKVNSIFYDIDYSSNIVHRNMDKDCKRCGREDISIVVMDKNKDHTRWCTYCKSCKRKNTICANVSFLSGVYGKFKHCRNIPAWIWLCFLYLHVNEYEYDCDFMEKNIKYLIKDKGRNFSYSNILYIWLLLETCIEDGYDDIRRFMNDIKNL